MNYNEKIKVVSILVPVYGVERYIERCARSLFEQTYVDIEYIFVDDCSPDRSIEILKQVIDDYPHRKPHVRIIRHEYNRGLAAARNTAVDNCQTEFLLHVDSDDYIDKTLVERCVYKQTETNCDIVLFDYQAIYKHRIEAIRHTRCNSTVERTIKLLSRQTPVCVWGGLYSIKLYKANGIKAEEGVNNNEDYQVTPRLSYYSRTVAYLDLYLYFYNCTNVDSITSNFSKSQAEQGWLSITILKSFFKDKGKEFTDALQNVEIIRLARYIKLSVEHNNRDYYYELRKRQNVISLDKISVVPWSYRLYLYVNNFNLLFLYTKAGNALKKFIVSIKDFLNFRMFPK